MGPKLIEKLLGDGVKPKTEEELNEEYQYAEKLAAHNKLVEDKRNEVKQLEHSLNSMKVVHADLVHQVKVSFFFCLN